MLVFASSVVKQTMVEVQCPSCNTRYRIDERILPKQRPTFKCSRCGHVFSSFLRTAQTASAPVEASGREESGPNRRDRTHREAAAQNEGPAQRSPGSPPSTVAQRDAEAAKAVPVDVQDKAAEASGPASKFALAATSGPESAASTEVGGDELSQDLDDGDRWVVEDPGTQSQGQSPAKGPEGPLSESGATRVGRSPRSEWTIGVALEAISQQGSSREVQSDSGVARKGISPGKNSEIAAGERKGEGALSGVSTPELSTGGMRQRGPLSPQPPTGAGAASADQAGPSLQSSGYRRTRLESDRRPSPSAGGPGIRQLGQVDAEAGDLGQYPPQFTAKIQIGSAHLGGGLAAEAGGYAARPHASVVRNDRPHSSGFFLMIFVALVATFAALAVLISSQPVLSREALTWVPFFRGDFGLSSAASAVQLSGIRADFQLLKDNHNALVISGSAANVSVRPLRTIEIRASLLDDSQREVIAKAVFCGNTVQPGMVTQMTAREIAFFQKLQAPLNFELAPGQAAPFVIAFVDPPTALARSYRVGVQRAETAGESDNLTGSEGR
jgi:predicted Zn finger-like uncharacterized protein